MTFAPLLKTVEFDLFWERLVLLYPEVGNHKAYHPVFHELCNMIPKNPKIETEIVIGTEEDCEALNSRMRDEFLAVEAFDSLQEAVILSERWIDFYNKERPHSALGYKPLLQLLGLLPSVD